MLLISRCKVGLKCVSEFENIAIIVLCGTFYLTKYEGKTGRFRNYHLGHV